MAHKRIDLDLNLLKKLYLEDKLSMEKVANKFNVSTCCVRKNLKRYNIKTRSIFEVNFKGGKYIDARGYIHVRCKNHPNAINGFVREHRLVMEEFLGRYLTDDEVVDHINSNKQDNRIENLKLFKSQVDHVKEETRRGKYKYAHINAVRNLKGQFVCQK